MSEKPQQQTKRETTHFGYSEIPAAEKAGRVGGVFTSVAQKYDLMNDLMSLGLHRLWKRFAVAQSGVRSGDKVLDVAGGSGDLAYALARRAGIEGMVVLSDINASMLERGRDRLIDNGLVNNMRYVRADAEQLPFSADYFHCITIAFGLRNVTHIDRTLASMFRCLRPGGRLLVLEFSRPVYAGLGKLYDSYSFNVIPRLGQWVTGDEASYRYLVESIRKHPDQVALKTMMEHASFERVRVHNLAGGIVALHIGYKF